MLAARFLMGVSEACYIPAALALITDYHKGKTRSLATGLHMSGLYAGLALGGLGGYISELWGWRSGFHIFGIIGIVYSFVLLYVLKDHKSEHAENVGKSESSAHKMSLTGALKVLFSEKAFFVLLFYFTVLGMVNWIVYGWLPTFLKDHFHLDQGEAGISATGYVQTGSLLG